MKPVPRELVSYQTEDGKSPFQDWLNALRDIVGRAVIRNRLNRVRIGNLGNTRSLGGGVFELKIDYGPGFRVYFGEDGLRIVVLLIGGNKGSQDRDIKKAKIFWEDYNA